MQKLGLSAADLAVYGAALSGPGTHVASIELRVLTMSGGLVRSIRPTANTGQVNIDADADVTRNCQLTFIDESRSLQFEPDSPADGSVYFTHKIQVWYNIRVPALGNREVRCPVFTGPLTKFDRTGDEVSIEAQGNESLALDGVPTMTLPKHKNSIDAIHDILAARCGETRFAFPSSGRRLPNAVTVSWADETVPWKVCKRIAASLGLHLFYPGDGVCHLRAMPAAPAFRFHTGEGGNVTSLVQLSHDKSVIKNRVTVIGSKPTHTATADLPASHQFSAQTLGVHGVPKWLREEISDPKIGSKGGAAARARQRLAIYQRMTVGATLNAVPVPHLDELDMVRVDTEEFVGTERLRQASFPLTGGDMTIGYNDTRTLPRRHVRKP